VSAIQLLEFQQIASNTIAERFAGLLSDPNAPTMTRQWDTFFYQALSALTGSGKTPILADAVAQMRAHLSAEPLVLWVSKHRVVVDQTLVNFQAGGKYENLVEGFIAGRLSELRAEGLNDALTPRLLLATTGSFNQKDKGDGTLRVHKQADDTLPGPLWEALRSRKVNGKRRPLIVVYDEGHNLTDQQTDLLLELEPEALLVASATLRTAPKLMRMVERLRDHGWGDDNLITTVKSSDVVAAGLVKSQIVLGGYETSMELTLEPMLQAFHGVETKATAFGAAFRPKAIYVCQTNRSQDDGAMDNHAKPFVERRAAPILIWRYLIKTAGIDPAEIAVYCDLKFDKKYPRPNEFALFSGGEDDYALFKEGNYRHIIFNLTLQEGWDDPECCFAYIDKSMGSNVQIEQVIGRVLRQPGAQHYADPDLNTAEFFVRMDDRQAFAEILKLVQQKLASEAPETKLTAYVGKGGRAGTRLEPKESRTLPSVHADSEEAIEPIAEAVAALRDYRRDDVYTVGEGCRVRAVQAIGSGTAPVIKEERTEHSNPVLARFVLRRALQAQHPKAANVINWADSKFDARIEINSLAAQELRRAADEIVGLYLDHTRLVCEEDNPHEVGPALVRSENMVPFQNAAHEGYSDLNPDEEAVAYALDKTGHVWARNPSPGGFSIPLLDRGKTRNFFPDFLVWKDDIMFAIDPKGEPYLATDAGRKLLSIRDDSGKKVMIVRLITAGRWNNETLKKIADDGYTAWTLTNTGKVRSRHKAAVEAIVEVCLDERF
jgi:type III restriction enzyme